MNFVTLTLVTSNEVSFTVLWRGVTQGGVARVPLFGDFGVSFASTVAGDFGDFGVSFASTVAGRYTRRGGPRLSVQGELLIVLTRGP